MDLKLKGKVALITGASKGIGAGIAKELAAEGVKVVVNYASSREGANRVVSEIMAAGGEATAVQANVASLSDVERLFGEAQKAYGGIDIVVNNAGIYKFIPIEAISESEFNNHFAINVLGPILVTQQALKHFPETGGSIINISSGASQHPEPTSSLYSASKAALDVLGVAFAKELASRKIRVNTVAPGVVETEGSGDLDFLEDDFKKQIIAETPSGRLGQPKDIAKVVVFLASDAADWITGDRISASGGLFI